jgi:DNA-binding transcriptional ArsR family regulator
MNDDALDAALAALADPTRRAVVQLLRAGPRRAGELAEALALSPPGLSRHLRVLRRAGLIDDDEPDDDARVRLYRLEPSGFAPLHDWIDELEAFSGDQLQAFKAHAEAGVKGKPAVKAEAGVRPKPAPKNTSRAQAARGTQAKVPPQANAKAKPAAKSAPSRAVAGKRR